MILSHYFFMNKNALAQHTLLNLMHKQIKYNYAHDQAVRRLYLSSFFFFNVKICDLLTNFVVFILLLFI